MNLELFINNVETLCKNKGISVHQMLAKCNLNKSVIDNAKKGSVPSVDKVLAIANYFEVSVDCLLGYSPNAEYNEKTNKFIEFANKHSDEQIDEIIEHYSHFLPKK